MISGPVVVQVLEGENAVARNREVMGATDPAKADPGTIRKDFAESIEANSVHGSDSPENAAQEIAFFFSPSDRDLPRKRSSSPEIRGQSRNSAIPTRMHARTTISSETLEKPRNPMPGLAVPLEFGICSPTSSASPVSACCPWYNLTGS